jgi:hypothetical protein
MNETPLHRFDRALASFEVALRRLMSDPSLTPVEQQAGHSLQQYMDSTRQYRRAKYPDQKEIDRRLRKIEKAYWAIFVNRIRRGLQ